MRARRAVTASILLATALAFAGTNAEREDVAAARKPIETYLRGHATGDGQIMRTAFLPTAHIEGVREGAFTSWTLEEYVARFPGRPADNESQRKRRIDMIEVSGTAATARVTLENPGLTATDFFVLLKVDGEWKIANKVYHVELHPAPAK